jgi:hypothetical protein
MRVVPVAGRGHSRRVLDFQYNGFTAFDIRQICLE